MVAAKEALLLDDSVLLSLTQKTVDANASVREMTLNVTTLWLLKLRERYGYAPKLLHIIICAILDENAQISALALLSLNRLGEMAEKDWEDRLKDEMDYRDASSNSELDKC